MSFLESIQLKDGHLHNLDYHQKRLDFTVAKQKKIPRKWNLKSILAQYDLPQQGTYKVRVVYTTTELKVSWQPYQIRSVQSLKVLAVKDLDYTFKSTDRSHLKALFERRGAADDIIIAKNGWITDSYYANLACFREGHWFTPAQPLLKGTKRQKLIDQQRLISTDIRVEDLIKYERVALINAMIDLGDRIWISQEHIYF